MAELATIARPYAEALFKAVPAAELSSAVGELGALAAVASDPQLHLFADNPKVTDGQVFDVMVAAAKVQLSPIVANFLRTVLESGRLAALTLMNAQFLSLIHI